jgi:MFS family permease
MPLFSRPVSHLAGFWIVAASFLATMAYATVPTPLYPLYQERDGFPVWVITMIFAAFAVGVVCSLFFAGHISDWAGRRRIAVIAVLVSALSAVLFLVWNDVPGLLTARFVNGVSIGILTATATAHLGELRAVARPAENAVVAASVAGAANLGGLALGPLIGGVFAEYLPAPLFLAHAVFLVVLLVVAGLLATTPETVRPPVPRPAYRPQRLAFPPTSRPAFVAAGLGAFASFALFGLFTSLAPTFLIDAFHEPSHLLAGVTPFAVFASAAVAQLALVRVAQRTQLTIALLSCAVGLVAIAGGALAPAFALFLLGGVVAGVGVGILFRSAIATAGSLAEPGRRGETLALIFLIAYCGLALPAIAVGISLLFADETTVLLVFSSLVLLATVGAGLVMRRRAPGRRST